MTEPDLAILLTAANRCVADRLIEAVATVGGGRMRPSFGFVLRAVSAERPTVTRLADLLGVSKQAASRLADDMVNAGFLERRGDPTDRRRTVLQLTALGENVRAKALAESRAMEHELRTKFGDRAVGELRELLTDFVDRHGGGAELRAGRSRAPSDMDEHE